MIEIIKMTLTQTILNKLSHFYADQFFSVMQFVGYQETHRCFDTCCEKIERHQVKTRI